MQQTVKESVPYYFEQGEKNDISRIMSDMLIETGRLEVEKKQVTSQYTAKINETTATAATCARQIRDGFEMRDLECPAEFDYVRKEVTIFHPQTSERVRVRDMYASEAQTPLPFEEPEEPTPTAEEIRLTEIAEFERAYDEYEPHLPSPAMSPSM